MSTSRRLEHGLVRRGGLLLLLLAPLLAIFSFWGEPMPRAEISLANGVDPKSLDPAQVTGSSEGRILRALLEGLTTSDPVTLEPRPAMAESWSVTEGGRRITFRLREAYWTNGDRVTPHDFEWSWRRLLDPSTAAAYRELLWCVRGARQFAAGEGSWQDVGIKALDSHLLQVDLEQPLPYFLDLAAYFPLYPLHPPSVEAALRAGVNFAQPGRFVSNGPFTLEARRLRDRVRVRRSDSYWDRDNVAVENLDFLSVAASNTQLNLFLTGQVDWVSTIPPAAMTVLRQDARFDQVYKPAPYLATYFYRVNTSRPPFDSVDVRRALSWATDRREIVERVTGSGEQVAWSFVPWPSAALEAFERDRGYRPATPFAGYRRGLIPPLPNEDSAELREWDRLRYDPERARALLRGLGYRVPGDALAGIDSGKEFPEVEILYNSSPLHERVAEVIQQQWWEQLGIRVRLVNQEWGSYLDAQKSLQYQVSRSMWIADYLDPDSFLNIFESGSPNNRTGWSSAAYEQALARAREASDPLQRWKFLSVAEELLMAELPIIPLYYCVTESLVSEDVRGFDPNPLHRLMPKAFRRVETP